MDIVHTGEFHPGSLKGGEGDMVSTAVYYDEESSIFS